MKYEIYNYSGEQIKDLITTRFENVAGIINGGKNIEMENLLVKEICNIAKYIQTKYLAKEEIEFNLEDLRKIAEEFFYEDYLILFKNKIKAKNLSKERVDFIIDYVLKENVQNKDFY